MKSPRYITIVLIHWLLHAYGIVSLTDLQPRLAGLCALLAPVPTVFYVATMPFTDPIRRHGRGLQAMNA